MNFSPENVSKRVNCNQSNGKPVRKDSSLRYLDPYLNGILRFGGRIHTGDALADENGPIIIHGKTYLARLFVLINTTFENIRADISLKE